MTAVIADMPVVATTSTKDVVSKSQTPITREHLEKVLKEKGRRLTPREMKAVVLEHPDLVSADRLERFKKARQRNFLKWKLETNELKPSMKVQIVKEFPQLLKNDPEKLLAFRYELHMVTPDERGVRGGLDRIQHLNDDLLLRAIYERESLGLTFVALLDMSEAQVNLVIAKSAELLEAKVLTEDEVQKFKEYLEQLKIQLEETKSPLQRQLEERHANGDTLTAKELTLLHNVRPDLVSDSDIITAKARENSRRRSTRKNRADSNRAMPGLRHKR